MRRSRRARPDVQVRAAARLDPPLGSPPPDHPRLGDLLVKDGAVSVGELTSALSDQVGTGKRIGQVLVEQGVIDDRELARALSSQFGVPLADLRRDRPDAAAAALIGEVLARELLILPVRQVGDEAWAVIADPADERVVDALQDLPVATVHVQLGAASDIEAAVNLAYRVLAEVGEDVQAFAATQSQRTQIDAPAILQVDEDAPVIQVVNKLVTQALRDRASDIHIEPLDDRVRVRYRVDGALHEVVTLPQSIGPAVISRIKILADMNIVERRRPQDGQFSMTIDNRDLDVRVSTTATIWGEKAVLRLLDKSRSLFRLSDLGMPPETHARYAQLARSPFGMLIVAGPTGSGKTTTLYATLMEINRSEVNVMTIEDPVEYVFPGINQIQINEQAELTFASGLKSILRQDPDVILVGEVRDVETARIAVQSALTGHFVLSSLHATDACSALYRLLDMGIESFLIASSITCVVAQRLVRRMCRSCVAPYKPSPQELSFYDLLGGRRKTEWLHGEGCTFCSGTGYRGRIGVYELLEISDAVRQFIVTGGSPHELRDIAEKEGLRPLRREAIDLVETDVTTVAEVMRTVYTV